MSGQIELQVKKTNKDEEEKKRAADSKLLPSETLLAKLELGEGIEEDVADIYSMDDVKNNLFHNYDEKIKKIAFINKSGNYSCKAMEKDNNNELPWYILMPNGQVRFVWDLVIFSLCIYVIVLCPVDISFNLECVFKDGGVILHYMYLIVCIFQFLDLILNCFTAPLNDRMEYVFDITIIIPMYLKGDFLLDLLTAIPWDKIEPFNSENCYQDGVASAKRFYFFYLFNLFKLGKGLSILDGVFAKHTVKFKVFKILLSILYFTHFAGTIFSGISPTTYKSLLAGVSNPKDVVNYYTESFEKLYFFSWYVGIIFLNGNDMLTTRNWELYYLLIVNVTSMILAAMVYGYISEMVVEVGGSGLSPILQQKLDVMNEYMRFKEFEDSFFTVIEEYLNNLWLKQRNIIYEDTFFDDLSFSLHKILLIEQWRNNYFKASKMLKLVSIDFFTSMIPMLKPKIFMSKDVIVAEGDISSDVFFNSKFGFCSLQIGGNLVKFLGPWEYFGEIAIFLRMKRRTGTVTCLKDSDFLMIESKHFEKLLMDYPDDTAAIGKKAKEDLMGSMKLYPSSLFAKLVPRNAKKDYLTRKSLYLTEAEEERIFFATKSDAKINLNRYKPSIDQIETMIIEMKSKIIKKKAELDKGNK